MKISRIDDLKQLAKDLRQEEPRPADLELGGLEGGARVLDKCRATLVGTEGEFQFGCPFDQSFARNAGIDLNEFKDIVATGASDEEVADWLRLNARSPDDFR
ncbi:MAG: DUF5069 domain-containing protein [Verrucomicrobiota bacterium]